MRRLRFGFFLLVVLFSFSSFAQTTRRARQGSGHRHRAASGHPVSLGGMELNLLLEVFNVLNAQRPILVGQRWGFASEAVIRTPPAGARLGVRLSL